MTDARFSLTVQAGEATGWALLPIARIDHLKVQERTLAAIAKAKRGRDVREIPAGHYPVILEPAAVAGLWAWLIWSLDAKSYVKGTSPFAGKLGQAILDERLSALQSAGARGSSRRIGFTADGLPTVASDWITDGVLTQLSYDRFTAQDARDRHHSYARCPLPLRKRIGLANTCKT